MIIDEIKRGLEALVKAGDYFYLDGHGKSPEVRVYHNGDFYVSYSRYASGGCYEFVTNVCMKNDKVELFDEGGGGTPVEFRRFPPDEPFLAYWLAIVIELADPNSFNKICEIIIEKASTMQTDRNRNFGEIESGVVKIRSH